MAFSLPSRTIRQFGSQSPCSSVCSSRPRCTVTCKAVLNLEPKPRDVKQQRDVSVKANAGEEALPLPDSQPQQHDIKLSPSFLDALVENTVKVPYVAYSTALREYPLATKACTSMMGFILGDLIAQVCCERLAALMQRCHGRHVGILVIVACERPRAFAAEGEYGPQSLLIVTHVTSNSQCMESMGLSVHKQQPAVRPVLIAIRQQLHPVRHSRWRRCAPLLTEENVSKLLSHPRQRILSSTSCTRLRGQ